MDERPAIPLIAHGTIEFIVDPQQWMKDRPFHSLHMEPWWISLSHKRETFPGETLTPNSNFNYFPQSVCSVCCCLCLNLRSDPGPVCEIQINRAPIVQVPVGQGNPSYILVWRI